MKRFVLTLGASVVLAAVAPASALAHHRGHHAGHRTKAHGARFERFGTSSGQSSTAGSGNTSNLGTAGTVKSYDPSSGELTILLSDGTTTVSGLVTGDTSLTCQSTGSSQTSPGDDDGEDQNGGSDNSGGDNSGNAGWQGDIQRSDDNGGGDDQNQSTQSCGASSLTPGAVVQDAELRLSSAGAVWEKVELAS